MKTGLIILLLLLFSSSMVSAPSQPNSEKIIVAVTSPALSSIVSMIGGERVLVKSLIPPGADPHHYEPSETDILYSVADAKLIVMTGPHHLLIEDKIEKLRKRGLIKSKIVNYKDYQKNGFVFLTNPKTKSINPHGYFFSVNATKTIALTIYNALIDIDPSDKKYFKMRHESFISLLDRISMELSSFRKKNIKALLLSPILQYVANDLGIKIVDIVLSEYDIEPTERDISCALSYIREGKVDLILVSDMEASRLKKMIDVLKQNNAYVVVTPVFEYKKNPYLAPLITASVIESSLSGSREKLGNSLNIWENYLLLSSFLLNIILVVMLLLLYLKVRSYE